MSMVCNATADHLFSTLSFLKLAMDIPQIKDKHLVSRDTFYGHRTHHVELKQILEPDEVWNYDISAILGAAVIDYDLLKTEVEVFIVDTVVGSGTAGFYIKPGAKALIGWREDGTVRVVNKHTADLSFLIRVVIYRKPVVAQPPVGG